MHILLLIAVLTQARL